MATRRRSKQPKVPDYAVLDDDVGDPVEYFEVETAARVGPQRITQLTADVVIVALHHFLRAKWKVAVQAMMALAEVDPTDATAVYALQRLIHPYLDACDFVRTSIEAGEKADQTIEETYQ